METNRGRSIGALAVIISGCLCAALLLSSCDGQMRDKDIEAIDAADDLRVRDFELKDHSGQRRRLSEFRGKVVALFFGYTQCPDVCPTTLAQFVHVNRELGDKADGLQVLFVTVDPERDTQQLLAEYMPMFHPRFIGMYGTREELKQVTDAFSVSYAKIPGTSSTSYTMDHTAYVFLIDPTGRLRLKVPHGQNAAALISLIRDISGLP